MPLLKLERAQFAEVTIDFATHRAMYIRQLPQIRSRIRYVTLSDFRGIGCSLS